MSWAVAIALSIGLGNSERPKAIADALCKAVRTLLHPYRPERHYMRGPGPKWREKHGLAESAS